MDSKVVKECEVSGELSSKVVKKYDASGLAPKVLTYLVDLIPDEYVSISGQLHAPGNLISSGEVLARSVLNIRGRQRIDNNWGFGQTSYSMEDRGCDRGGGAEYFCNVHRDLDSGDVRGMNPCFDNGLVVTGQKLPCGIFLYGAGFGTGEEDLSGIKRTINHFVEQGYLIDNLTGLGGQNIELGNRSEMNSMWNLPDSDYSHEGIRIYHIPNTKCGSFVELFFNKNLVGTNNFETLFPGVQDKLEEMGLEEVVE